MPSKQTLLIIGLVTFLALVGLYSVPFQDSSPKALPHPVKRGIMHIVMFEFKDETTEEQRIDISHKMLALKDLCVHPLTHLPYIKTTIGGRENSFEGLSAGISHAFIEEFETEGDRKYYIEQDPAHREFKEGIEPMVKRVQVVDFTPGIF